MSSPGVPAPADLPSLAPHLRDHSGRRLCRALLRASGWRLVGHVPNVRKLVLIAAPHSSWWDGIWGLLMKIGMGLDVGFMAKRELFRGPLGWLLRHLGGIPITRHSARGVVEQMIDTFRATDALWLGLTPEGTRRQVAEWKTGFWHIAQQAGVPVFPVAFHYPDKSIHLGSLHTMSDNIGADLARLRAFYAPFRGKHHDV